jgi:protein-disulfide isomerase-like protein with CxxC motif
MFVMSRISVTHFSDPGCPWAYSASPAMTVLRWRYAEQLDWRLVTIGLAEDPRRYIDAGYTPTRMSVSNLSFRRYGMPFLSEPRPRIAATSRACRAIVATRLRHPGREHEVLRALQLGWFTTTLMLDEDEALESVLSEVPGLDAPTIVAAIDDEQTIAAYEADKQETRSAVGGATELQGKARQTDGPVRFSAPSLVFEDSNGRRMEAGGFQPVEAYDVIVANLDPTQKRRDAAPDPLTALKEFPTALSTQEVAAVMAQNNQMPDRDAAERALLELLGEGAVRRRTVGDGALWQPA